MNLTVSAESANWYKNELQLNHDQKLRLFVRYGDGGHIPGFSLGIRIDEPNQVFTKTECENVHFFIETSDAWYFDDTNLAIEFDEKMKEPTFIYK